MQNSKQVIFIHIPKTGGISIRTKLKEHDLIFRHRQNKEYNEHTPFFLVQKLNDLSNFNLISVIRNPYKRAYSLYKSFLVNVKSDLILNDIKNINLSFNDFLNYVRLQGSLNSPIIFNNCKNACFDQCFYLMGKNGLIEFDKIYKFEQLSDLENDFNIKLEKINDSYTTEKEYVEAYSIDNINLVRYLYGRDFYFLNYSNKFDDSMK